MHGGVIRILGTEGSKSDMSGSDVPDTTVPTCTHTDSILNKKFINATEGKS